VTGVSDSRPVNLSTSGPPEAALPVEPAPARHALALALQSTDDRRGAVAAVVAGDPRWSRAWAALATTTIDPIEQYAYFRVGYHRGLDALRGNGWRGSGYVRWEHPSNRGFLLCLAGLARVAAAIGETDEAERCDLFLRQCDPSWPPADLDAELV
jgi:hypothetical protein